MEKHVKKTWLIESTLTSLSLDIHRGNTFDSHRLIYFAGEQGLDKQHNLVEELGIGYFTEAKFIGDRYACFCLIWVTLYVLHLGCDVTVIFLGVTHNML